MSKTRIQGLLATTFLVIAATCATANAAGLFQMKSGTLRNSAGASQVQVMQPGSAHFCLPDAVSRRVELAYGNSSTELSPSGQQALRGLAQTEWESWVMLHQGHDFSSLAMAADVRSRMGFNQNRNLWWMSVSARPCK